MLFHDGSADWTFYDPLRFNFGVYGEGAHVGRPVIGYVGNTGTTVYHLHFEYHPGAAPPSTRTPRC